MARLAFIANERVKFDAYGTKTEFLLGSTIWANRVAFQFRQALNFVFSGSHDLYDSDRCCGRERDGRKCRGEVELAMKVFR